MNKSVEIKRDKNDVIVIDNGNELSGGPMSRFSTN